MILSPEALAVGPHVVRLIVDNLGGPGVPDDEGDVTFFVDAC